ncbi:hypothetical protein [Frankia sp. R82]|uniref:hypothetical protein n=1 Tax=Frankia sp. R82 TaxID=2950553 RepID=UPI00204403B6|nr:hypothetical protein [Frankia sp. R82]MCM3886519.1 hypothetical protein [Frankia sp. R82]
MRDLENRASHGRSDWRLERSSCGAEESAYSHRPLRASNRASIRTVLAPGWLEAAAEVGHVLVGYGPKIGVRTPPGARSWHDADRRGEFTDATRTGLAAGGLVRWT